MNLRSLFKRPARRGQALVETAILLPVLLMLLMLAIDLGRVFFVTIDLRNAAHEVTMFGGTQPDALCPDVLPVVDRQMGRAAPDNAICGSLGTNIDNVYITQAACEGGCDPWSPRDLRRHASFATRFASNIDSSRSCPSSAFSPEMGLVAVFRLRSRTAVPSSWVTRVDRLSRSEKGQSLVEFALVVPIVVLIMVGLFDLGHVVFQNNTLSDGARQGARIASVNPRAANYCSDVDEAVRSATRGLEFNTYTVTYQTINSIGAVSGTYRYLLGRSGDGRTASRLRLDPAIAWS